MSEPRIPVFLDCDTGVDDALAIAYLLASDRVELVGVGAVMGNVPAPLGARNTLDLLALAGAGDVPVAIGAETPLHGPFPGGAPEVHGADGIGGVVLPAGGSPVEGTAIALLSRLAREYAGRLQVIAIGPLTNLALALDADPNIAGLVAGVTIMGGALLVPGNVTPAAEANIWHDPEAAEAVFDAGWSVTVVGLDVTMQATLEERHRAALQGGGPVCRALAGMLEVYFSYYLGVIGRPCCALHDPLAAAVAIGAVTTTLAPIVPVGVDTTSGPNRGRTTADLRSRFRGYPRDPDARHRVVLGLEPGFPDALTETLLRAFP